RGADGTARWSGAGESRPASNSSASQSRAPAIKGAMRNILLVFVMTACSLAMAAGDPLASRKPAATATPDKPLPVKRSVDACAAYGPDFVKVKGSDTCVKVGGDMSVSVRGR